MDGSSLSPRAGGPSRRRSFTPTQKLEHLAAYGAACERSEGGAYLRREGLYSSLISEWRRLRDAGVLEGKKPGARVGRPSAEQARSHSRPSVSNDNPYSESLFKTMKYAPVFPERFGSIGDARAFMDAFATAYNHEHHHTGIDLHTPADVHYGDASDVNAHRSAALETARRAHPERFATSTNPKILALPDNAWINQPAAETSAA